MDFLPWQGLNDLLALHFCDSIWWCKLMSSQSSLPKSAFTLEEVNIQIIKRDKQIPPWEMVNTSNTKNIVKAVMHNNPFKNPTQAASHWGKACLKRKVFACLRKDSRDGASLASSGKEFQSESSNTESSLLCARQTHLWRWENGEEGLSWWS